MSAFLSLGPASSSDQPSKGSTITPDVTSGHLTHLTHDQEAALALFKDILAKAHLYTPPNDPDGPRPSHDEPTLLLVSFSFIFPIIRHLTLLPRLSFIPHASFSRFLRARRFDPQKASKQFADSEAWRATHNVEDLYATFPIDEFENTRRFYPRWTGRRDKV